MLSSFFTNKILHIAAENSNKQQTHRPILPMHDKACLCHKQDGKHLRVLTHLAPHTLCARHNVHST